MTAVARVLLLQRTVLCLVHGHLPKMRAVPWSQLWLVVVVVVLPLLVQCLLDRWVLDRWVVRVRVRVRVLVNLVRAGGVLRRIPQERRGLSGAIRR